MQTTRRIPLARGGLVGAIAILLLLALPGASVAGGMSESAGGLLQRGAGYDGSTAEAKRVRALQHELRAFGWRPGPVDGLFGPRTEAAVARFQQAAGIAVDGIAGPATRRALVRARTRPLRRGDGYAEPAGSPRVRELQRALRRHGMEPGPVDGRFGPLTEAAVARLERAAGLPVDGVVAGRTRQVVARAEPPSRASARRDPSRPDDRRERVATQLPVTVSPSSVGLSTLLLATAAALLLGALTAAIVGRLRAAGGANAVPLPHGVIATGQSRSRAIGRFRGHVHALMLGRRGLRRGPDVRYLVSDPGKRGPFWVSADEVAGLVAPPPDWQRARPADGVRALGYVSVPREDGDAAEQLREQARQLDSLCERRGWRLVDVVRDADGGNGRAQRRPGLMHALERIERGEASCLVVSELERLSHSAADLSRILERLEDSGGRLVAMDVGLDTAAPDGQVAARTLASVGSCERRRLAERTREGLTAARAKGGAKGRPAVEDVPALKNRIVEMRTAGMTLQAIADRLNEEGVPTLRGGAKWRPSSVQAAAGYRRPKRPSGARRRDNAGGGG